MIDNNKNYSINFHEDNRDLIISVQENERQRIARDLHDASLQNLTHMVHQLELCDLYMNQDITKSKLELLSARQNLKKVIEEIRHVIFDLHPMTFDDLGLKQTYENFFDTIRMYSSCELDIEIDDIVNDNSYFLLSIYRIGRECIMNSIRHSKGSKIWFKCVERDDIIYLYVKDNGIGFTEEEVAHKKNHFGLTVIHERVKVLGGTIKINSDQCGTEISIEIPIVF